MNSSSWLNLMRHRKLDGCTPIDMLSQVYYSLQQTTATGYVGIMDTKIARNLSIKQIRAFVTVARYRSFSQAALELAISQPALTLSIQQFEEIVGVSLMKRTTRSVSLTRQGQEFLPKAEKILKDIEDAVYSARLSVEKQENRVKIAVLPSVAIRILPDSVRSYAEHSPQTAVCLQDDNGRGVQAQVMTGAADFGISNIWEPNADLEFTPFLRDRVGLICRSDHELARRKEPLTWSCIEELPFVAMAPDTGVSRLTSDVTELPTSVSTPAYTVLTIVALVGILENGTAVSALPALAAPDYLNPSLVYRDLSDPVIHRELCLITPTNRKLSKAAKDFLHFLNDDKRRICARFPNNSVRSIAATA